MTVATKIKSQLSHSQLAIRQALSLCRRHNKPLSLVAIDLSELASLDAEIGMQRTQSLSQQVNRLLSQQKRCEDVLVRYSGGNILLALLPLTPAQGARSLARRIIDFFDKQSFQLDDYQIELPIRISLHCCADVASATPARLINDAIKPLRQGNDEGRILLTPQAEQLLGQSDTGQCRDALVQSLLDRLKSSSGNEFVDSLMPALNALGETERMQLVDRLLDMSTGTLSRFASH